MTRLGFILRAWLGHYWRRLKRIEIDWTPVLTGENYWKSQRAIEQDERRRGIGDLSKDLQTLGWRNHQYLKYLYGRDPGNHRNPATRAADRIKADLEKKFYAVASSDEKQFYESFAYAKQNLSDSFVYAYQNAAPDPQMASLIQNTSVANFPEHFYTYQGRKLVDNFFIGPSSTSFITGFEV